MKLKFEISIVREIDQKTGLVLMEMYRMRWPQWDPVRPGVALNYKALHRDPKEGPAYVAWDEKTGRVLHEEYFWQGRPHRDGGPACVNYDRETGQVWQAIYYQHGRRHRDPKEGPAVIQVSRGTGASDEQYFVNGRPCRDPADGPYKFTRTRSGEIIHEHVMTPDEFREAMAAPPAHRTKRKPIQPRGP